MKTCFKCNVEKELTEFYKHKKMADGHMNKCKSCNKIDASLYASLNKDKVAKIKRASYKKSLDRGDAYNYTKLHREKFPKKYKARYKVNNAIMSGELINPKKCSECYSNSHIQAHHDDYNKPLDIRWLCSTCHTKWHRNNSAIV